MLFYCIYQYIIIMFAILYLCKNIFLKSNENFTGEVLDFLKDLTIIVVIVLVIRTFFVMPFQINGQSMYESYYDKEFIIVDRFSYFMKKPIAWDVIVFKPHVNEKKEYFLKRIIGVEGDTVRIEDGLVSVKRAGEEEFVLLDEQYLSKSNSGSTFVRIADKAIEYTVPAGSYFVMWDNRNHSTDSRDCFSSCSFDNATNYIKDSDITGKVLLDLGYFSFTKFSFQHPNLGIDTTPRFFNSPKTYDY